jgi:hypothetical protein
VSVVDMNEFGDGVLEAGGGQVQSIDGLRLFLDRDPLRSTLGPPPRNPAFLPVDARCSLFVRGP